jgi:multidrug efflux pump subunit AcrA (membrane-fusion protein)
MSQAPKLRDDLTLVEQTYRGEQSYIVKDPKTRKYFRFRPVEVSVIQLFDGLRSPAEVAAALAEGGMRVSAGAVEGFANKLKGMGLLERTIGERSVLLMERLRAQRRQRLAAPGGQSDIFRLRWSMGDPDQYMNRTMPYLRWMYSRAFLTASVLVFAIYFLIIAVKWGDFTAALGDLYHLRYSAWELFVFWCTASVIIVIHELGHGYTCKYFGGEVHEIGAMLLYFEPAFFCNVNDSWTFPELKARLWVTAAGSWIQFVVAGLASLVWWAATPDSLVSHIALSAMLFGGVTTILMNANPLIPLDGYFALSDYLEVPNLRQRAFGYLGWVAKARVLGLDVPAPAADEREQRIFLTYSLLALAYIASIMLMIAGTVYGWLDQALGLLGGALFVLVLWLMARSSLRVLGQTLAAAWREARARVVARRLRDRLLTSALILILVGAIIPRPITVTGPFVAAPALSVTLTSPDSGLVGGVYVREGTRVQAGMPLVQVRDLDLERAIVATTRRTDSLAARVSQARAAGGSGEVARLETDLATDAARLAGMTGTRHDLTVRALVSGVVVTRRPEQLLGQWVSLGERLLEVGQPDSLELRIALVDAGATLVRAGQPARLVFHADGETVAGSVTSVAPATSVAAGAVDARVGLHRARGWRPRMTGEASVTLRRSNLWGALWWGVRKRVRTDLLL